MRQPLDNLSDEAIALLTKVQLRGPVIIKSKDAAASELWQLKLIDVLPSTPAGPDQRWEAIPRDPELFE